MHISETTYQLDFDHFFCYTFNLITEQFYEIGLVKLIIEIQDTR